MKFSNPFARQTISQDSAPKTTVDPLAPKESKAIYFLIGTLVVLIIAAIIGVIIGANLILNYQRRVLPPAPAPLVSTPSAVPIGIKSHATDSAVLKVRDTVQGLQREINSADYFETEIAPPTVDFNIQID